MWVEILVGIVVTVNLGLWGWTAVKVIDQGRQLVELTSKVDERAEACSEHLVWNRNIESKLCEVAEGVAFIRGSMEGRLK